jgi:penicillin-binding protein 2
LKTSNFDPISSEVFNKQIKKATLVVLVIFCMLILRLWFLQILNGETYRTRSETNRIRLQEIFPFRGKISDRNGHLLAGNRPSYDLYVIPEELQNQRLLLKRLKRLIGLDPRAAEAELAKTSRAYPFRPVCVKRDISRDELAVIETHRFNLPGVMIKVKPKRNYTCGSLASHVLGFLGEITDKQLMGGEYPGIKPGDMIGKSGVEKRWQSFLYGARGGEQVEVDAAGRRIRVLSRKAPVSGANIVLTVDKDLQAVAEDALSGKKGAVVAIDPQTGALLALASSPSVDPNLFVGGIDKETWEGIISSKDCPLQNRAIAGQYPPGSLFKIVVALAGLHEGVIEPKEELYCNGTYPLGQREYRCWKKHGHGKVDLHRALVESCDIYFYKLGKRVGVDRIARYAKNLGLGRATGFDLDKEKAGLIPTSEWKLNRFGVPWQAGETVSISIGQSYVLVTPIQMATLISTIFNGGTLLRPGVTKRVGKGKTDKVYEFTPISSGKAGIRQEDLEIIRKALIGVVHEPRGTGGKARLNGITIAGKTATAQVVGIRRGDDLQESKDVPPQFRDHAWFLAAAPAENPKIALAVLIEHGGHGGSAAAPIARKIIKAYLDVTEDGMG